jgi:hypothetical protein
MVGVGELGGEANVADCVPGDFVWVVFVFGGFVGTFCSS